MALKQIQNFDNIFSLAVQSLEQPLLTVIFVAITFLGNPGFWFLIAAMLYWKGKENLSFYIINVLLFSLVAVGVLKRIIGRTRPSSEQFLVLFKDYNSLFSFPSGHATTIAAQYSFLKEKINPFYKQLFVLAILLVALSRVYLGVHFLTDVIAGVLLGILIGVVSKSIRKEFNEHHFKLSKLKDEFLIASTIIASLVILFFFQEALVLGSLLGFYTGFFLAREKELKQSKISKNKMIAKQLIGITGLGLLMLPFLFGTTELESQLGFVFLFLGGFWASFAYPSLFEKVFNHQRSQ